MSVPSGFPRLLRVDYDNWYCLFCNEHCNIEDINLFFDHMASHTGKFRFSCGICNLHFPLEEEVRAHIQEVHETEVSETENQELVNIIYTPVSMAQLNEIHGCLCDTCGYFQMTNKAMEKHLAKSRHSQDNTRFVLLYAQQVNNCYDSTAEFTNSEDDDDDFQSKNRVDMDFGLTVDLTSEMDPDKISHTAVEDLLKSGYVNENEVWVHYDAKWTAEDPDPDECEDVVLEPGLVPDYDSDFRISAEDSRTVNAYWEEVHEEDTNLEEYVEVMDESDDNVDEDLETNDPSKFEIQSAIFSS